MSRLVQENKTLTEKCQNCQHCQHCKLSEITEKLDRACVCDRLTESADSEGNYDYINLHT